MDLNSVLLEGVIQSTTQADEGTGYWIELVSATRNYLTGRDRSTRYQINVRDVNRYPIIGHQPGQRIRVVGRLQRSGRKGLTILAEAVEKALTQRAPKP
jgi:hypothetical protein